VVFPVPGGPTKRKLSSSRPSANGSIPFSLESRKVERYLKLFQLPYESRGDEGEE
jgi:hypothetical protein